MWCGGETVVVENMETVFYIFVIVFGGTISKSGLNILKIFTKIFQRMLEK
jgi:hypothetical protein